MGLFNSSASAQTITLNTNSPTDQGSGTWAATGTWSMPNDTATVKYTFNGIDVEYRPAGSMFGRKVTTNGDKTTNPWTWMLSDTPGAGTYSLPFRLQFTKKTYDANGNLVSIEPLYAEALGNVTVQ